MQNSDSSAKNAVPPNPISDSLPKPSDPIAREFMQIMCNRGSETLDERLTATYLRALKPDVFSGFQYHKPPFPPNGWQADYEYFKNLPLNKKTEGWKILESRYEGFIKARDDAKNQNDSDAKFLQEAHDHLKKIGAHTQADQYKLRLQEYDPQNHLPY